MAASEDIWGGVEYISNGKRLDDDRIARMYHERLKDF